MQFVFAGIISGAIFAMIENFVYILQFREAENVAELAAFRWVACTSLHVVCAAVASLGLVRVWRRHLAEHRPAQLVDAYPYFLAAMILHGTYNTWAVSFGPSAL